MKAVNLLSFQYDNQATNQLVKATKFQQEGEPDLYTVRVIELEGPVESYGFERPTSAADAMKQAEQAVSGFVYKLARTYLTRKDLEELMREVAE